jgi:hypothetical protein
MMVEASRLGTTDKYFDHTPVMGFNPRAIVSPPRSRQTSEVSSIPKGVKLIIKLFEGEKRKA